MDIIVDNITDAFVSRYSHTKDREIDNYCSECSQWGKHKYSAGVFQYPQGSSNYVPLCADCIKNNTHIGNNQGFVFYDAITFNCMLYIGDKPVFFNDENGNPINRRVLSIVL